MKKSDRSNRIFYLVLVSFIILTPVFLYITVWQPYEQQEKQIQSALLRHRFHTETDNLQATLNLYTQALYSARGFITANHGVSRNEWKTYYQSIGVVDQLPGLGMLAYIQSVPAKDKESFITKMRADKDLQSMGVNFTIYPDAAKSEYQVAMYLEPSDLSTTKTLYGFDFSSEEIRRNAFEKARDTNRIIATAPIRFVSNKKPGYVMMLPLYDLATPIVTPEQRRSAYKGLVLISVRIKDIFDNSFAHLSEQGVFVQVYDGQDLTDEHLIYQNMETFEPNLPTEVTTEEILLADRILSIKYTSPILRTTSPAIPSVWVRLTIFAGTNALTAFFVWARLRPKKI